MKHLRNAALIGLLSFALFEASLHVLAWFVADSRSPQTAIGTTAGEIRILCLGDSNTYGLWLEKEQAWPVSLERSWNRKTPTPRLQLINLAFPGTTSTRILKNLPGVLETFRPDYVFLMAGHNDWWSPPVASAEPGRWFHLKHLLYRYVRSYRLFYMMQQSGFDPEELKVDQSFRVELDSPEKQEVFVEELTRHRIELAERLSEGKPIDDLRQPVPEHLSSPIAYKGQTFDLGVSVEGNENPDSVPAALAHTLRRISEIVSQSPARLISLTYPSNDFIYGIANGVIRDSSGKSEVPVWDLSQAFLKLCGGETTDGCTKYFLFDQHPNARGHELVAQLIEEDLAGLLLEPQD